MTEISSTIVKETPSNSTVLKYILLHLLLSKLKFKNKGTAVPSHVKQAWMGGGGPGLPCSTPVLKLGGWSMSSPGRFTQEKGTWYPFYRRLGGSRRRSERVRIITPPLDFEPRNIQPVAGC